MSSVRGSYLVYVFIAVLLVSCGKAVPSITPSPPFKESQTPSPSQTPMIQTLPELTNTPTTSPFICGSLIDDYCVLDGKFILMPPIAPPGMDKIDRGYPYGSTAGGTRNVHHGVEFYNGSGTPVLASASGKVIYSGDDNTQRFSPWDHLYGNLILLEHPVDGMPFKAIYTLYGHLSRIDVLKDQLVTAGQKIGEVGATGAAIGSHLHFEVRLDPQDYFSTLNPEMWIAPRPGNGTLAIGVEEQNGEPAYPTFTIQYFPDRNQPASSSFEVDPYADETINPLDPWKEIACLGDQPAGWYRITFYWNGLFNEYWAELVPGKLVLASFIVKE